MSVFGVYEGVVNNNQKTKNRGIYQDMFIKGDIKI